MFDENVTLAQLVFSNRSGISYTLIPGMKATPLKALAPPQGFLWNSSKSPEPQRSLTKRDYRIDPPAEIFPTWHSVVKRQAPLPTSQSCKFVNVTCSNQLCGIRPHLGGWDNLPNTEGRFPWHATLFLKGQYLCGATLVAPSWLLTSINCFYNIK